MNRHIAMLAVAMLSLVSRPHTSRAADHEALWRWGSLQAREQARQSLDLWNENPGPAAIARYQQGYLDAVRRQQRWAMWWYLTALGIAHNSFGEYRQALDDWLAARDVALHAGFKAETALALSNLSSLYLHVYDKPSALAAAREAFRIVPQLKDSPERIKVLVIVARVFLTCGEGARATSIFQQVIRAASRVRDAPSEALAWDQMGWELLVAGDLARAENALNEALRLRVRTGDRNLFVTEHHLALLNWKKGDVVAASQLIDAAFAHRGHDRLQLPEHLMYLTRARIRGSEGGLKLALADYLHATEAVDDWRGEGLLADTFRISTDALMNEVYAGAIDTAAKLYRQSGQKQYAVLAWELSERIRAASLRELVVMGRGWTRHVTPEYWRLLEQLHSLEAEQFATQNRSVDSGSEEATRVRMHLAEMEARAQAEESKDPPPSNAGPDITHSISNESAKFNENSADRISLSVIRKVLGNSRTLISFCLGDEVSYRWVISERRFELSVLPGKRELGGDVARLREALRDPSRNSITEGEKAYSDLFSGVLQNGKSDRWFISLDDSLFKLPIAALITGHENGRPVYLIERKTVELVAGAWAIGRQEGNLGERGFVGMGDGIYNTADPRYRADASSRPMLKGITPALFSNNSKALQLPRLIGSGMEVEQCARRTGEAATILTGAAMNRAAFLAAVSQQPAVIHVAAHFLTEPSGERTAIALGLKPDHTGRARLDVLTAEDIANLHVPGSIVVMSGCSSVTGQVVPAAGLLGLVRAWLAAGAHAVIATQWPAPDDTGELFLRFYEHLRNSERGDTLAPAEALRRAQVDMLHSGTWRSEPRYWAAYQITGRSN